MGFGANQLEEILKKDHTYDHIGNIMEIKKVKTEYLPHLSSHQTKASINLDHSTV